VVPPNYEGPLHAIESDAEYNIRHQEHVRIQRERLTTAQQLQEREIGVKISEDELMRRRAVRMSFRATRGRGRQ